MRGAAAEASVRRHGGHDGKQRPRPTGAPGSRGRYGFDARVAHRARVYDYWLGLSITDVSFVVMVTSQPNENART